MFIDFRGQTVIGADIQLTNGCVIANARLIDCMIDDVENSPFDKPPLHNCILENCTRRSDYDDK